MPILAATFPHSKKKYLHLPTSAIILAALSNPIPGMTTTTKTVLVGAGILLLLTGKKIYSATALNFYPSKVSADMDGLTPTLRLTIAVQNPSDNQFILRSMVANLYANDNLIGNGFLYSPTVIKPLTTSFIALNIRLSLIGIAMDIYQAIVNKTGFSQALNLNAHTLVDGVLLPVNLDYKIG